MNALRSYQWFRGGLLTGFFLGFATAVQSQTTNSVVAFGLTFTAKEGSVVNLDENNFPVATPIPDEDWGYGYRIWLGEADTGVFGYPGADFEHENFVMRGVAYGSVGGVTNQIISTVQGVRDSWGMYTVTADLSPLGPTDEYNVLLFDGTTVVQQSRGNRVLLDYYYGGGSGHPRVNPCWRLSDGDVGVLIELDQRTSVSADPDDGSEYANRIVIRLGAQTNRVDYVSHVDVTATTLLPSFILTDARVGAFQRVHKALGPATLGLATNRVTLTNLGTGAEEETPTGVAIELDEPHIFTGPWTFAPADGAGRFEVELQPVRLATNGAALRLEAIGSFRATDTNAGDAVGSVLGSLQLANRQGVLELTPGLPPNTTNVLVAVYERGNLAGTIPLSGDNRVLQANGIPSVLACGVFANSHLTPAGYAVCFGAPTTFSSTNGLSVTGDELRVLAVEGTSPLPIASLQSFLLTAANLPSFSIIGERQRPIDSPPLSIAPSGRNVVLTWPDPNRLFFVEASPDVQGDFSEWDDELAWADNLGMATLTTTNSARQFLRLRSVPPSQLPD